MRCADEGLKERQFERSGEFDPEGRADYVCTHCGWMQVSPAGGAAELCRLATWHSLVEYEVYRDLARTEGYELPDAPLRFEP